MIDPTRHESIFHPDRFGDRRVDVIGAGATGSRIALSLAKLGVMNLHVHDFDTIAEHNIANQLYPIGAIGELKVLALRKLIEEQTGLRIRVHATRVTGETALGDVVFVLTDSMASRKEIFEGLRTSPRDRLLVETRMGADNGRVYALQPNQPVQARRYEATLYDDDDATVETSLCGTSITVNATADMIAGMAVWQFINWWQQSQTGEGDGAEFELLFGMRPSALYAF